MACKVAEKPVAIAPSLSRLRNRRMERISILSRARSLRTREQILPARFPFSPETAALGASTAAATAAEAVPAAAFLAWPRLVDIDRASAHFRAIQALNRAGRLVCVGHLDESETAWLPRIPVPYDAHAFNGAEGAESGLQLGFSGLVRKVSYENICHGLSLLLPWRAVMIRLAS